MNLRDFDKEANEELKRLIRVYKFQENGTKTSAAELIEAIIYELFIGSKSKYQLVRRTVADEKEKEN